MEPFGAAELGEGEVGLLAVCETLDPSAPGARGRPERD
jgi:hypothetical protein